MAVRSNGPETGFWYVCTATLTLEIWPWVKVMTHPWVMDNNCVKYYPDPTCWSEVTARTRILSRCALWPWPWRYDLRLRSWHILGSWTTIVWNIIKIPTWQWELWPGHEFWVCVQCDLDLRDMTLGQGHDTSFCDGQQLCEILSRSNMAVRSFGPDTVFLCVCTATLTLEIWPWAKVMTHPWVMDNNFVKYYQDPTSWWRVMARTQIFGMCALRPWHWSYDLGSRSWHTLLWWTTIVWNIIQIQHGSEKFWPGHWFLCVCTATLTLEIWPWAKVMTHPWVMDNNFVKYYQDPTSWWRVMARTQIFGMCALRPWHWRYDLGSRSWHTLLWWTTIVWNIIQIQHGSEKFWPGHWFLCVCTATLTLEIWPWVKVMTHPLVMNNNCVKYYQDSNMAVRLMARTRIFGCVCSVTLTLEIWPWVKVMTHPFVMDNNCVKYYPDLTWQWEVLARTLFFVCVHCNLDLGDMTFGQGHDTLLSHG